jgi:hypothetical protein
VDEELETGEKMVEDATEIGIETAPGKVERPIHVFVVLWMSFRNPHHSTGNLLT